MEELLIVDEFDNITGKISKQDAHKTPVLHRAFSVFLYHDNKILIQKRAANKYHSGGLWANTCCSHPRTADTIGDAVVRLKHEVGITIKATELKELFTFTYLTKFNDNLYEHELDHVLVGKYNGKFEVNKDEVSELKWVDVDKLSVDLKKHPEKYASWFVICAPKVIEYIKSRG